MPIQWVVLTVWPYVALAANLCLIRISMAAWLGGLLATLAVTTWNACCALRQGDGSRMPWLGMLAKLLHIPAYVMSAVMALLIWMAPPLVLALLATNACMLLATSAYTLRGICMAWRGRRFTGRQAVILAASQLIFVLDVVGSIILYICEKRRSH